MAKKQEEKETYSLHVKCRNCGYESSHPTNIARIPMGQSFEDWTKNHECPTCGCNTLEKN